MAEERPNDVPKGGIFDTEQYKRIKKLYEGTISKANLSNEEKAEIDRRLACPDARPALFDGTLEAWLLRISLWGKIKITRYDPDAQTTTNMDDDMFLNYIDNKERNDWLGKFIIEAVEVNKIRFYRKYDGVTGMEVTEEIMVEIDLRPDLKERLKKASDSVHGSNAESSYNEPHRKDIDEDGVKDEKSEEIQHDKAGFNKHEKDDLYAEAVKIVLKTREASALILQRRLGLGYIRAASLLDMMEKEGIVGPYEGSKPRKILK